LTVRENRGVAKVRHEGVGSPAQKVLDLSVGEAHAVENDTGTNMERVAGPVLDGSCILDCIKLIDVWTSAGWQLHP
jgi:hypothetical protein